MRKPADQLKRILEIFDEAGVSLKPRRCEIEIEKKDSGGIRLITFGRLRADPREVISFLRSIGLRNAVVKVHGDAGLEDFEELIMRELTYKKAVIAVNKIDLAGIEVIEEVKSLMDPEEAPIVGVSAERGDGLKQLRSTIFKALDLIRVYTRKGGETSDKPLVLPRNSTVRDLAELIHREFAEKMKYARVWGRSVKVQGQKVGADHVLEDGDIVEVKL
ncbi:MAG: hypothetical protein DRN54_01595 [Thaumarchaeota archaeon]|nr:MAG: hypothetical protein DRN54_01595 [Nitrososphaerota archaeon]